MNLNQTSVHSIPFQHWELNNCLNKATLREIMNTTIPKGERAYDGTRAADYSGKGIDGKLRLFITKENAKEFPYLKKLINELQSKIYYQKISDLLDKNLSDSFVRLEIISDKLGFWLKPHKDIPEKLMTMMIWVNPYNEANNLGTDLYNHEFKVVKTVKYQHNCGYFFASGQDTWHGLEKKEIQKERRCLQINYVTFKTDWPVE
jgi:hypothetical protein